MRRAGSSLHESSPLLDRPWPHDRETLSERTKPSPGKVAVFDEAASVLEMTHGALTTIEHGLEHLGVARGLVAPIPRLHGCACGPPHSLAELGIIAQPAHFGGDVVDVAGDEEAVFGVANQLRHVADRSGQDGHSTRLRLEAWVGRAFAVAGADVEVQRLVELAHFLHTAPAILARS